MSEFYDKIARGLNEAIAFEEGKLPAKTTKYTVAPVTSFAPRRDQRNPNFSGNDSGHLCRVYGRIEKDR